VHPRLHFNERRFDDAGLLSIPKQSSITSRPGSASWDAQANVCALVAAWLIAFDDVSLEITSLEQVDDHTLRADFIGHGTHTGDLMLGEAFILPATGIQAKLEFTDMLTFRNGWIVEARLDFDVDEMRRRLTGKQGQVSA
jgi:hypothetical protein